MEETPVETRTLTSERRRIFELFKHTVNLSEPNQTFEEIAKQERKYLLEIIKKNIL